MSSAAPGDKYLNLDIPRKIALGLLFLLLFLIPALSYAAPAVNSPGFWIKKLKNPDEVVLTKGEIDALNSIILDEVDQMAELSEMPDFVSGDRVFEWLWTGFVLEPRAWYDDRGLRLTDAFMEEVALDMNIDGIPEEAAVRFGVVVARADIRALPTDTTMHTGPSRGFDSIQYTSAYPAEPVALLHVSRDGQWGFFQTRTLRGWMRTDRVAFGEREEIFEEAGRFLVVTGNRVPVYKDPSLKEPFSEVKMGAVLRLERGVLKGSPWTVSFPMKGEDGSLAWKEAYLAPKADVHVGYLPYTRRNIIRQAFKMLGEEYGWGGREGLRDCSLFIKDIFSTVGLRLPRNSRQQGSMGDVKAYAEGSSVMSRALKAADPGVTLLTLSGHVMLHIGEIKGRPYVIHQIFGYNDGRRMKLVNRAAVTGLELGKKSRQGSFRKRLRSITDMRLPVQSRAQSETGKSA